MKARIDYCDNYHGQEGYSVEICINGIWGLDSFFPLVRREGAKEDEEKNFVHFGLINKIAQLNDMGYTVTFM